MDLSGVSLSFVDYEKLCKKSEEKGALELVKKSLKPPTRPPLPQSEIYLDGCFTCSDDQLAYVVSPLYISLKREWLDVFQYLLALCPTIVNKLLPTVKACDVTDVVYCASSETLLHLACRLGLVDIIQDLLDRGASTEIKSCKIGTPLHVSARSGKLRAMELLLDSGADIEARNGSGFTPLLTAVAKDMLASVQLLLERGADITATSYVKDDVFSTGIRSRSHKVLTYMCERNAARMFASHSSGTPAPLLLMAASSDIFSVFSALVKRLVNHTDCPPQFRADASLISTSCTVFTSEAAEKFKNALQLKQDLQVGPPASTPSSSWYGEYHEVSSVQEWEEMQPGPQQYYLQGCLILERCLGSDHHRFAEHLAFVTPLFESTALSRKLCLRHLDMIVRHEQLKLESCNNALFQVQNFTYLICSFSDLSIEFFKLIMKGFEVFVKLQERHSTCSYFKTDPTPQFSPGVILTEAILTCLLDWIAADDLHHKAALDTEESRMALTQFRDVVGEFVQLSHSALHSRGLFNVTWWPSCFKDNNKRNALVFLISTLLQSEAVSRVNIPDPITGIRPLRYFYKNLGKVGITILLSYGAHLDVASTGHRALIPGKSPLTAIASDDVPCNSFNRWILQEAAVVPDVPVDIQLSSPLPLLCQCSWAILREKIPYHQLHLPSWIKDYIALHETEAHRCIY